MESCLSCQYYGGESEKGITCNRDKMLEGYLHIVPKIQTSCSRYKKHSIKKSARDVMTYSSLGRFELI